MSDISRRAFVGSSLAPAAYAAGAQASSVAPSDKVRIGLVGCGGISTADSNAFLAHPETEIVAVCDVDDAMLAKTVTRLEKLRGKQPETAKDYRRIVERKDVDVVLVCTPDHWHALPAIAAMQAGKDVYVEKPLATSVLESKAVRDAARRYKSVVQMGTHWRSGPHYAEAVEMVRAGKIGKVRQVRCFAYLDWVTDCGAPPDGPAPAGVDYDMWLGPAPLRPFNKNRFHFNFRWFWDYGGGLMTDWGVHLINIALWAMGPEWPKSVISSGGKYVLQDNTETPDTQITVYDFPSYTLIWEHQVQCGLGPDRREHAVVFTGSDATLILDTSGWEIIAEPKKRASVVEMRRRYLVDEKVRAAHARNFLDCVKSRQQPVENLEVGHHVTAVSQLGNVALRSKSRIEWDAAAERVIGNDVANGLLFRSYRAPWKLA
ncbi:MAG: Gfo/Idh/MocA family oxidoreductase [Candidatus Solibacter usitatus]|nr:Gfo/Idh/MocA family oxidoreductase [Candidatus Solibacter usitatus]